MTSPKLWKPYFNNFRGMGTWASYCKFKFLNLKMINGL